VAGIRCAREAGLHTLTNTTLVKASAGRAPELVDFLHGLGLRTFAMNGYPLRLGAGFPGALGEAELRPVLERVRERARRGACAFCGTRRRATAQLSPLELGLGPKACNAAEYSLCLEPDGAVLPCQSYYEPVGNLLRDPGRACGRAACSGGCASGAKARRRGPTVGLRGMRVAGDLRGRVSAGTEGLRVKGLRVGGRETAGGRRMETAKRRSEVKGRCRNLTPALLRNRFPLPEGGAPSVAALGRCRRSASLRHLPLGRVAQSLRGAG